MTVVVRKRAIRQAEEIFGSLGSALQELRIYTEDHPRFLDSCRRVQRQVRECFESNHGFEHLTFTLSDDQIYFQGLPLFQLPESGRRLAATLEALGSGGLQLRPNLAETDIAEMVRDLFAQELHSGIIIDPAFVDSPTTDAEVRLLSRSQVNQQPHQRQREPAVDLDEILQTVEVPGLEVSRNKIRSILSSYRNLLSNLEAGRAFDFESLKETSSHAVELLSASPEAAAELASQSYFDDFTFHHSLNVCLLTTAVAGRITSDPELLRLVSITALLHDVGKSQLPAEILYKKNRLTPAEFKQLKTHPILGAEILLSFNDLPAMCPVVAFGHHVHDGPGSYPRIRSEFRCDWLTELVSVVDVYEALTAVRPYKKGLSSKRAFEIMLKMPGLRERRRFIRLLYNCLGPFPLGSVVELNTGERACVVSVNPQHPSLPRVKVLTDRDRQPLDEPVSVDLAEAWEKGSTQKRRGIVRSITRQERDVNLLEVEVEPEPKEILGHAVEDDRALMAHEG